MKYLMTIFLISSLIAWGVQDKNLHLRPKNSTVIWDSTTNWKIYPLDDFNRIFRIPIDSLKYLKSIPLNTDTMRSFLIGIKELTDQKPIWMGCYLTSCQTPDGTMRKVIISHYAGFLYYESEKRYYLLDLPEPKSWLEYLSNAYQRIIFEAHNP